MINPEWKQPDPQMQLKAVLMAAQWHVENVSSGMTPPESLPERYSRISDLLSQAQELANMVSGEWPAENKDT